MFSIRNSCPVMTVEGWADFLPEAEMDYIKITTDHKDLYVEKDSIEAIVLNPEIQRVPKASGQIRGISYYHTQLVVYYRLGELKEAGCGVILKSDGDWTAGVAGREAGEEAVDQEVLTEVLPGIWEKKCD